MHIKQWWKSGTPWVWFNAGAVSISLVVVVALLSLILVRGLGHFWSADVVTIEYHYEGETKTLIGEIVKSESIPLSQYEESGNKTAPANEDQIKRWSLKIGNKEFNHHQSFVWVDDHLINNKQYDNDLVVIDRVENGKFYGYLTSVNENSDLVASGSDSWVELESRLERVASLRDEIQSIKKNDIGAINYKLEKLRLERRSLELDGEDTLENLAEIAVQEKQLNEDYFMLEKQLNELYRDINRDSANFTIMDGREITLSLATMLDVIKPNTMGVLAKLGQYVANFWHFMADEPRESNTEGGVFPAIFGTVMMVLLMSVFVTPLGVIAAVYLREYARQGVLIRIIRIAVNNLAGVPSIVYGVFGLGFFVYFIGGNIDQWFYPESLPAPTLGTPGLLWASLTLALLTLPVVIVSTEEGLARIPSSIRQGSLALGATKAETLWKVILPMSSPAIMTGLILAVARAAGEVAPLMLVGVVKLAPELPLDLNFPFLHVERKFMHLGFHIYDVGFQSPDSEAARPLVYATSFLLVLVIVLLNLSAIMLRNKLREKYRALDN